MILADRYELGEVIGTGGMSDVYAATDTLLGRGVAVKVMRAELARDDSFRERFRREATNAGKLNHATIVAVYDSGEWEGVPYIVMERVHGRTLRDIVREQGPMTPAQAASTLIPVCEALQVSHDAGIIHRDIKPANIMITNTGAVKVMDFGIARAVNDSTAAMTQTAAVIGTAQYLSPEQARGRKAEAASDVYALGCVLYEVITGRPPFEGESPVAVAYQHVHDNPTPPSEFISGLTPTEALNIDAVTLTAMAKHPADRYQSATEMADDLGRVARNTIANAARTHVAPQQSQGRGAHARPGLHEAPTTTIPTTPAPAPQAYPATSTYQSAQAADIHRQPAQVAPQPNRRDVNTRDDFDDYDDYDERGSRWPAVLAGLLAVVLIGVGGVFAYDYVTGKSSTSTASTVAIPSVSGMNEEQATTRLRDAGFTVDVRQQADPKAPRGTVIATNPASGSKIVKGSTVTLIVSSGKEITEVPDLTGRNTEEAAKILESAGLELDRQVKEQPSDTVKEGAVIEQSPRAGNQVSKGTKVAITVSTGVDEVRVPVITGLKWERAEGNLTSLGFVPVLEYIDSDQPEGTVVSAEGEGSDIPKGSDVAVKVSRGNRITMPDLTGLVSTQALATLRGTGWAAPDSALVVEQVKTPVLLDQGKIAGQTPAAGQPLIKDAPVTVQVYVFDLLP